ncbi:hypothetical protein I4U23_021915 [Adineta vaga]|nr:hypothetical protein I4U23_021915 [Adineta vaga]
MVKSVLCNIATYIHKNSASGLIEQSTMTRLCSESLTTSTNETNEERVSSFVRIIREEIGVLAARGEYAYGFLHLTFQEYFVALEMLDVDMNVSVEKAESVVSRFFEHMNDPRYREPLLLAMELISWKCSPGEYDSICCELLSKRTFQSEIFTSLIPLGAMLFVSSVGDLVKLPSNTLIFDAFDQILFAATEHQWHSFFPDLEALIANGLSKLPLNISQQWALPCANQNTPPSLSSIPWLDQSIVNLLWTLLSLEYQDEELIIDYTLVQLVQTYPSWFDSSRLRFRAFVINRNIIISSNLLSLVIAFICPLLIRYFHPDDKSAKETKLASIIEYCIRSIKSLTPIDHSLRAVDSFLALFCLKNINDTTFYQPYIKYKAFHLAQKRIKRVFENLNEFYFSTKDCISSASTDGTEIINKLVEINEFDDENSPIDSSVVKNFLNNLSAIIDAVNHLQSKKSSFLYPGLPKFLRHFWSLHLAPGSISDDQPEEEEKEEQEQEQEKVYNEVNIISDTINFEMDPMNLMSNSILKIHLLSVILSHPCVTPLLSTAIFQSRTLQDEFIMSIKQLSFIESPMITSLLIVRCFPHAHNNDIRSQLVDILFKKFHNLKISSSEEAEIIGEILSTCSAANLDPLFIQEQQKQLRIRNMKSCIHLNNLNSPISIHFTPSQQTTLAAYHLVELAHDVQRLTFGQNISSSSEHLLNSDGILTALLATNMTQQIRSTSFDLEKIDELLQSFQEVTPNAVQIVQEWLLYDKDE